MTAAVPRGRALVVFANDTSLCWLRLLRRGFRHCFVAVAVGGRWVVCDPLSHYTDMMIIDFLSGDDLAAWYRSRGLTVVDTAVRQPPRRLAPIAPFTCTEAVKRVLAIHARWVVTPWQLYRHLTRRRPQDHGLDTSA